MHSTLVPVTFVILAECAESLTALAGHNGEEAVKERSRGEKEAVGFSLFHFMVFFAILRPQQCLGHRDMEKKYKKCVGGEGDLSAVQRRCGNRLALPGSEVNGSLLIICVREDFAPGS